VCAGPAGTSFQPLFCSTDSNCPFSSCNLASGHCVLPTDDTTLMKCIVSIMAPELLSVFRIGLGLAANAPLSQVLTTFVAKYSKAGCNQPVRQDNPPFVGHVS
jgi:hypothetical protein